MPSNVIDDGNTDTSYDESNYDDDGGDIDDIDEPKTAVSSSSATRKATTPVCNIHSVRLF